jgi:8-oxo-dGTP pyrophosphatase MutT (NUDIX family)
VVSNAEAWRRRIEQKLREQPQGGNPGDALLEHVVGAPSAELLTLVAAPAREAAVLIGLIERAAGPHVLLTERAAHLAHHPGQISFPGGRLDEHDADPVAAALREAEEEVGLAAQQVEVLGRLAPRLTGTGFAVTPVVGWLETGFQAQPDPAEVSSAFEVPIAYLLAPGNLRRTTRERYGTRFVVLEYQFGSHRIWGATAAILTEFLEVIDAKTI